MFGSNLVTASVTYGLMLALVNVGVILVCVLISGSNCLFNFYTAIRTGDLLASFCNACGFFDDFSWVPAMCSDLLIIAFGAYSAVIVIIHIFPLAESVLAGILHTDLTITFKALCSGISFFTTLCANTIFLVRMFGLDFGFIIVITFAGSG